MIDGKAPARPDQALEELAGLMKDRLVGALRLESGADIHDWHALLLLLCGRWTSCRRRAASPGHGRPRAATTSRSSKSTTRRCSASGAATAAAEWDRIINFCLQGDAALDAHALAALLDTLGDSARFGELIERLQSAADRRRRHGQRPRGGAA